MTLAVHYERFIFVSESGSAEEVACLTLKNSGEAPCPIGEHCAVFPFTEIEPNFLGATHPYVGAPEVHEHREPNQWKFYVGMRGDLQPSETQTFCVHVRRNGFALIEGAALSVRELTWNDGFGEYEPTAFDVDTVIVFPRSGTRSAVHAPGAEQTSSRAARWAHSSDRHIMAARSERKRVAHDLATYDNLLAEAYRELGRALAGREVARSWPRADFAALVAAAKEHFVDEPLLNSGPNLDAVRLRPFIDRLWALRPTVEASIAAVPSGSDYNLSIIERVLVELKNALAAGAGAPLPENVAEVLEPILALTADAHGGARRWSETPNEQELHDELHRFLHARGLECVREQEVNNGYIDLVVLGVPIELKVGRFGGDVERLLTGHGQQAAEYAVRRGKGAALLVGLDKSVPSSTLHGPHLAERVRVARLASAFPGGVGTPVVGVLISAIQPEPSSLSGKKPCVVRSTSRRR